MSHHPSSFSDEELITAMRERIESSLPGSEVQVSGGGGHFEIDVAAKEFEGLNTLKKQRLVYSAIKELMAGDSAPVHAIDRMITRTPDATS
ncbi:MAG: BolA/IbaG family iron-sulfur metabolism protein [Myxococcota bacterium]|nr:BolA/IbaG family iron-sulfur metabolism protein [Myxococcota bacterium]